MMESMFRAFDEALGLPPPVVRAVWVVAPGACAASRPRAAHPSSEACAPRIGPLASQAPPQLNPTLTPAPSALNACVSPREGLLGSARAPNAPVLRSPARRPALKAKLRGARDVRAEEWDEPSRLSAAGKETATCAPAQPPLAWKEIEGGPCAFYEATVGVWPEDGVRFRLLDQPEYPRRGSWCLTIESCQGAFSGVWGMFDRTDQPMRYFHSLDCAKVEANLIAQALFAYRVQKIPGPATSPRPAQRGTGA